MDALHIAAAMRLKADELITTEKPTSPVFAQPAQQEAPAVVTPDYASSPYPSCGAINHHD